MSASGIGKLSICADDSDLFLYSEVRSWDSWLGLSWSSSIHNEWAKLTSPLFVNDRAGEVVAKRMKLAWHR